MPKTPRGGPRYDWEYHAVQEREAEYGRKQQEKLDEEAATQEETK